jgi:hypothetical protein
MNEKRLRRWRKTRRMGSANFVCVWGALFCGGAGFLLTSALAVFWIHTADFTHPFYWLAKLAAWAIAGALCGHVLWVDFERRYQMAEPNAGQTAGSSSS